MSPSRRRVVFVIAATAALAGVLGIIAAQEHVSAPPTVAAATPTDHTEAVSPFATRARSSAWRVVKDDQRGVTGLAPVVLVAIAMLIVASRILRRVPDADAVRTSLQNCQRDRAPPVPRFA